MSLDQAKLLIERMKSDEAFSKRVLAIEDVAARLARIHSEWLASNDAEIKELRSQISYES